MNRRGFTLMEVMIAMAVVSIISAIVYTTFATVTDTVEETRVRAQELRLRQFLTRNITMNLSALFAPAALHSPEFYLLGVNDTSSNGPSDSLEFWSSAPAMGALSLPGDIKRVTIEILSMAEADEDIDPDVELLFEDEESLILQVTETPLYASGAAADVDWEDMADDPDIGELDMDQMTAAPSWTLPVHTLDILYYDPLEEEWVEEWDSQALQRMPWAIQFAINFARTPAQLEMDRETGIDIEDDPDVLMTIPLPRGMGTVELTSHLADPAFSDLRQGAGEGTGELPPQQTEDGGEDDDDDDR